MEDWLERFASANFRRSADTAHDLKTPLNVAVLNLELLRMRLRKIQGGDDERVQMHAFAIEGELRRLGRIFDAFFALSTPPRSESPGVVDLGPIATAAARSADAQLSIPGPVRVVAHEDRMAELFKLFFNGARGAVQPGSLQAACRLKAPLVIVEAAGPRVIGLDLEKVFKLYYADHEGNPEISLAVARLIAETYGGELIALEEGTGVVFRLSLPLGER